MKSLILLGDFRLKEGKKMIYEADMKTRKKLFPLFKTMHDTTILSCLQGHMGKAWVDNLKAPTSARILVGDFMFFAGNPHTPEAEELVLNIPKQVLVIVDTDEWKEKMEDIHKGDFEKVQRYSFNKNMEDLDREHIQSFLSLLPDGYELKKIDATLANEPSLHELSEDFTGQFDSIEDFLNRGVGFAITCKEQVACGASSYSIYDEGIEIEIVTHSEHRRKGLATVAAAALILDCLDKGLYPSWDAANATSAKLAQRLGYVLDTQYDAYYIHKGTDGETLLKQV